MARSRVYVETSVVSYLTSRLSRDLVIAAHQEITREWWDSKDLHSEVFASALVLEEARRGDPEVAAARVAKLAPLSFVPVTPDARRLAARLLADRLVPQGSEADALHIALATVHEMQFLVTWNFRHIANPHMRLAIESASRDLGFRPTVLCSPMDLFEGDRRDTE
jgi:predicted nucleic acid-binding protein